MWHKKIIYNITPFSLLDFPDKTSCILWFVGCNMRCSYCYNPEIVFGKGRMDIEEVLEFIVSRKGLLDGVVFSGGECTLHKETIPLAKAIKELGMLVKVDTNGLNPAFLEKMLGLDLIDSVSMDFKALPGKFEWITGSRFFESFNQSLQLMVKAPIPFELRTTFHSELLNESDLLNMIDYAFQSGYTGTYFIQNYIDTKNTIGQIGKSTYRLSSLNQLNRTIEIRN